MRRKWSGAGSNRRHTDFQSANKPRNPREKRPTSDDCQQIASSKPEIPSDLQAIIDAWPTLPDAIKAGIVAIVRSTHGT
jgi:hypothetical protein